MRSTRWRLPAWTLWIVLDDHQVAEAELTSRVLFRGGGEFGLAQLDTSPAPSRPLVLRAPEQALELRSHVLLQVTAGSGTWSMEGAP